VAGAGGSDSPRILFPPPLVYLAAFGLAMAADRLAPWRFVGGPAALDLARWGGWLLVAGGVTLDLVSLVLFIRRKTSALPFRPAARFVASGPYRFTRNPMYLGMSSTLAGVGLLLGRPWVLVAALAASLAIDRWVIRREERYLERTFGAEYRDYCAAVRRWI
jgi:protein-S-isoprenylcysteine O-methyltransferase Ste14